MRLLAILSVAALCVVGGPASGQDVTLDSVMAKVSKGKPFVLVLLLAGKPIPADKEIAEKLHGDHLVRLFQLEKDGKISVFGPVTDLTSELRGIIIFNDPDITKARMELDSDPYIKQGFLKAELHNWFTIPGQRIP